MRTIVVKYLFNIIALLALQILIFNYAKINIGFWEFVPYVYILGIMILPFETEGELLLIIGFLIGLIVDFSLGSFALHTSATVFIAFFRNIILSWIAPRLGYNPGTLPSYQYYGFYWAIKYALFTTVIHHFVLFLLDYFSLKMLFFAFAKAFINGVYSSIFIVFLHYFVFRNRTIIS